MESELRRSILLGMAAILAGCGGGSSSDNPEPDPSVKKSKMTVLLYINGSDLESGVREEDGIWKEIHEGNSATNNIQEMLQAISNPEVNIILQTGGTRKKGWDTLQRKQIKNQNLIDLEPVNKPNASFADPQTLIDYVQWSKEKFPAEKYILIFWNHGGGPIGGFGGEQINLYNGDAHLRTKDLQHALEISAQIIGQKFELIGFDACLMASLEIIASIKSTSKYFIASEDIEPGAGWDYTSTLNFISKNSQGNGNDIGEIIVNSFVEKQAKNNSKGAMLSCTDLSKVEPFEKALSLIFKDLDSKLSKNGLSAWLDIAKARSQSLDFVTNIFLKNRSLDLMDIGSFLSSSKLKALNLPSDAISNAVQALNDSITFKRWDDTIDQTSGMTMYFPSLSITNKEKLKEYNQYISPIDGIYQFINNYSNFANSNNIPKITLSDPFKMGVKGIASTVSSEYFEQAYAALISNEGNIISVQDINHSNNLITLNDFTSWPTVNGNPVPIAAIYNVDEDDDTFITYAIHHSSISNKVEKIFLIFEKINEKKYRCNSYYIEYSITTTHNTAPRIERLLPEQEIGFPSLKFDPEKNSISAYFDEIIDANTGKNSEIILDVASINVSGYQIYLGTSDLLGRMSFSSQPAVI